MAQTMTRTGGDELPRVDPLGKLPRLTGAYAAFLRTPPGRWLGINVASRIDPWVMRKTNGRFGMGLMLPHALLTTRGAKSGAERINPVLYFHDGDDVILIASSWGREKHPNWYYNVRAHPEDVRLGKGGGGQRFTATEVTDPAERAHLWQMADRIYPGYAHYRELSGAVGREIPIFRLVRA